MSENLTMTLTEFLLARYDEAADAARDAAGWAPSGRERAAGHWRRDGLNSVVDLDGRLVVFGDGPAPGSAEVGHIVYWDPARVLADCEAKRRIVERFARLEGRAAKFPNLTSGGEVAVMRLTVMDLALPYADHPDYRDEWRP